MSVLCEIESFLSAQKLYFNINKAKKSKIFRRKVKETAGHYTLKK